MSTREILEKQVEKIRDSWKCKHCGGDIKDQIYSPYEQEGVRQTLTAVKGYSRYEVLEEMIEECEEEKRRET